MALRYEEASRLYQNTLKQITKDERSWTSFLRTACKNYRLSFADLVMIYAQRPDAIAVLEMEDWNRRYGLWIKTGSKGIAVFDDEFLGNTRLRYYFDISDTRISKTSRENRAVPLWEMKKEFEIEVIKALVDKFGPLEDDTSLASTILSTVQNVVEDNIKDYLNDLQYCKEGTLLQELDEQNTAIIYQNVIYASVAYTSLTRCGIHAEDYISDELRQISIFTETSVNAVGVPMKDMSQMIINEVRKTVLILQHEENKNRTFVKQQIKNYNEIEKEANTERSQDLHETKLYTDGGISNTQPDTEIRGINRIGEIRIDEKEVSQGTSSNTIHELFNIPDIEPTLDGNRSSSQQSQRTADETDDGKNGNKRTTQGNQSDGVGSINEQYRRNNSRTDQERVDLQLNTETAGTQSKLPAFFTQDEFEELLKYDRFRNHKNKDIQTVFECYDNKEFRMAYVKESFTTAIIEMLYQEERLGFQRNEENDMLRVWKGDYLNPDNEGYVSWDVITSCIDDMIKRNVFLSIPMKSLLSTQEQQLNLFEMEPLEPYEAENEKKSFSMPQHIVDAVLAEGAEDQSSKLQIAIFLSLNLPTKENAEMLKNLYGKGSNGFIIENKNVAYMWNTDGIHISWGRGIVTASDKQTLSWVDVSKGIRNLLNTGRYMSQKDLDKLDDYEYKTISNNLFNMYQNIDFELGEHMMELRQYYKLGFVDGPPKVAELLKTKDFYDRILNDLYDFNKAYQQNHNMLRWKQYEPDKMILAMERLKSPHLDFHATDYDEPNYSYFITQDTIDDVLTSEHTVNQKYRTYSFYKNHSNKQERIKFLKEAWGFAGNNRYSSDSKGIEIKTGSFSKPYAKKLLKWKDVTDRLAYLIANNKYLTPKEIVGMEDYERDTISSEIKQFYCHLPFNNIRPYQISDKYYNEDETFSSFLRGQENVAHVLDLMHIALSNTDESFKDYDMMKEIISHVLDFYNGTYTLFNQKKQPKASVPYEPISDTKETIAKLLTRLRQSYDPYGVLDQYDSDFEKAISDNQIILNDIGGLEDLILFLNEAVFEIQDPSSLIKALILREEISMLYAERKNSDLSKSNEINFSYHATISQEQPRYNTGDFVFFLYEHKQIYARIEIIDEDMIILNEFSDDFNEDGMFDVDVEDFEKAILHDFRNDYLYDPNRPLLRVEKKEEGFQIWSDKERNTLGYQNYVLIKTLVPMILNKNANIMTFINPKSDSTVTITLDKNRFSIKETTGEDYKEYVFALDVYIETLNIREVTELEETDILELTSTLEPTDYNVEQQMNEYANEYIKSITDRGFQLKTINMQTQEFGKQIVYASNGNIEKFNGTGEELDKFLKQFVDEPIQKISSLVPRNLEGKEKVQLIEKVSSVHENYLLLKQIAPLILSAETYYMNFINEENRMSFIIELLDENHITMGFYYEQNGDMITDSDMEFVLDTKNETLSVGTFQQDNVNVFNNVKMNRDIVIDEKLEAELNNLTTQWLNNIQNEGYYLKTITLYPDNYSVDVVYGDDGFITSFNGSDEDLKWYQELFDDDPQERISTLIPYRDIENVPTQKATFIDTAMNDQESIAVNEQNVIERHNFKITDYELGKGGLKEKYQNNVSAIKLLFQLEQEQRLATSKEQQILSKYVGWGALSEAFDENKVQWKKEYEELKTLLNEDEYKAARASTLTAFYTPPVVIEAIYQKLMDMGLKEGNLLEPSCGVGNFIGMQPDDMDCNFYGVELDSISGRIAQQLYQKATIAIQGFEQTELSDNLFDAVIGNVPYGQIPIYDPKYNQQHFMIHDYFFAKALDKVKVGGVIIFLTSKFTMDKKNRNVRKYIAQRADLLGAIRLPDNTFSSNAGTRVTTDILILQKRERPFVNEPDWLDVMNDENGIIMNRYFINHPEMVLGTMVEETSQYGISTTCKPLKDMDLKQQLVEAMGHIKAEISIDSSLYVDEEDHSIPADPSIRNYSFCIVDGSIYYRENSRMYPYTTSKTKENRIRGMVQIRDCMRKLIDYQTDDFPQDKIEKQQEQLHELYDSFIKKYDLLNSRGNKQAFQDDSSYNLICSLEILNEDKTLKKKADIFYKRTIKPRKKITSVKSANEALVVCMAEKGYVDFSFMTKISQIDEAELIQSLKGVIYPNPEKKNEDGSPVYETADEYLSGNIREKLVYAKHAVMMEPNIYQENVTALEKVHPKPIKAGDISVRLGTTWIPIDVYKEFMFQLLNTPGYYRNSIDIHFVSSTQEWSVTRKSLDNGVKATKSYGTHRVNAYKIIENTLNLRDVKVYDKTTDDEGKEISKLNNKETAIAQDKQELIKSEFNNWIWKEPKRRDMLCAIYNERFNSIRNRTYDGSYLSFIGMNPDITLREHQVNAIARILYGGNTLLAHSVGAGKTFEMIAAGMESKRLGFCSKPLFAVPNNIIGDFASDFYRLYPSANILVATTDTLSKANRHKFFARIASGDWDGVIITHSQFIKMPISEERQRIQLKNQVEEISNNVKMLKENDGERFTIKQLEKMKRQLLTKLEKLNNSSKKDDILCFENLGIDMLFVDEADLFKNLFLYSKMRNVSGISQTDSQRASDLFNKTQYLNELTGYRGVVFATGTAISNSMAELYTMQRYLQYDVLQKNGLESFDSWASTFGETVTAMELSPEGKGFKMKTRFSKFYNLPELMTMFREVADIQTPEMLNLPVPNAKFDIISVPASNEQEEMIKALGERAEKIKNRSVKPYEDNMLKITSDGRKLALDQRLMNPLLPEHEGSKINACVDQVYKLWKESADIKGTQLLFCDLSTPTADSKNISDTLMSNSDEVTVFNNVYEDIKRKLIIKGIPSNEIAFIHDAKTDTQRKDLFAKTRQGTIRILLGSTSKMGAGTNVQDLIVALHDLDCPWRPRDLEQRRGRGIRQGNINETVHVIRYVTKGTFDAYLYQTIEKKQQFISEVLTDKTPQRSMEEIDEAVMEYAAIKAIACGDPKIMERCNLELEVNKLNMLKASYQNQIYELQDSIIKTFPKQIAENEEIIKRTQADILIRNLYPLPDTDEFVGMVLDGVEYKDKSEAGNMLLQLCKKNTTSEPVLIGNYRGFDMKVSFNQITAEYILTLEHDWKYIISLGADKAGNLTRINNALNGIEKILKDAETSLSLVKSQMETAKIEIDKPFEREAELQEKSRRLSKLTIELKLDKKEPPIIDENEVAQEDDREIKPKSRQRER